MICAYTRALVYLAHLKPGDGAAVHFVGTIGQTQRADMRIHARQARIARHAHAAMRLDGIVDHTQRDPRRRHFDHGDLELRGLVADLVHHVGGFQTKKPRHLDVDARLRDALLPDGMLGELLAEGDARQKPLGHFFQRHFGGAKRAHAMMDPAGPEAALCDLEAAALAEQEVAGRHAHVLKQNIGVAVRRIVKSEHRQHAQYLHAGRIERNENLRLLLMPSAVRVGLAHDNGDLAARVTDAGRPPFAPVDHIVVSVANDRSLDIGRVGRSDTRLGHQKGGTDLAGEQRFQPLGFLLMRAVAMQNFHVAGIGRRAIEDFRRPGHAAHLLRAQRVVEIGQSGAVKFAFVVFGRGRQKQVPETFGFRLGFELFEDRNNLPAIASFVLPVIGLDRRIDMRIHEGHDAVAPMFLPLGHRKVHDVLSLQFCVTYPAANRNSEKAQMPWVRFGHAGAALEPLRPAR